MPLCLKKSLSSTWELQSTSREDAEQRCKYVLAEPGANGGSWSGFCV